MYRNNQTSSVPRFSYLSVLMGFPWSTVHLGLLMVFIHWLQLPCRDIGQGIDNKDLKADPYSSH